MDPQQVRMGACRTGPRKTHVATGLRQGFARVGAVGGELGGVQATKPWDGLDGDAVEEDEFSLDDIMADDS